jgi:hypothetical protein
VESDGAWSESYYFNCYDPDGDVGLYTRIGIRPNEGTIDVALAVWAPDGVVDKVKHVGEQRTMIDTDIATGGVRYEMLEAGKRWRLSADTTSERGPVTLDVTFEARMPMLGTDGQHRAASEAATESTRRSIGKGHLEQAGVWSGWIEAGGRRTTLGPAARGNRDKSWGPRRWGGPKMWRWFSINIDDDTHFGGILIGTDSGELHRGWVWRDGRAVSIANWDVLSELEDDGITHRATHVVATDKAGAQHVLDAEILRIEPGSAGVAPNTTLLNEGIARWTYEGRTGTGISEYLHQLDADARPIVVIT